MTDRAERAERKRLLAKRLIDALTVICVTLAVVIAASQLAQEGLQQFLYRPPGVGASPSQPDATVDAATKLPSVQTKSPASNPALDSDKLGIVLIVGGMAAVGAALLLAMLGRVQGDDPSTITSY